MQHSLRRSVRTLVMARWLTVVVIATVVHTGSGSGVRGQDESDAKLTQSDRRVAAQAIISRDDADEDGFVTMEEAAPSIKRMFSRLDVNQDGKLDLAEIENSNLQIRSGQTRPAKGFDAYDSDRNGALTREEAGTYWVRLQEFDANEDGEFDRAEYEEALKIVTERRHSLQRDGFRQADTDSDGELTLAEFRAADRPPFPRPLFQRADSDQSGAVDTEELDALLGRLRVVLLPPRRNAQPRQRTGQRGDFEFALKIKDPAFETGEGPLVLLDEAHSNYHTLDGRYKPFVTVLREDGYVVKPNRTKFSAGTLEGVSVLVISNALAEQNKNNWRLPTLSAFSRDEIDAVLQWVSNGGALLLIADHMPFAGAAEDMGAAFEIEFLNGFAIPKAEGGVLQFGKGQHPLRDHAILRGRNKAENVDLVVTFTGSAFRCRSPFQPLLEFGEGVESLQPEIAWQFTDDTQRTDVSGWYQAAVAKIGTGRVAVFGEAAMFSAQRAGGSGRQVGMNAPEAKQNLQFLLNTMHWLTGVIDD